jgi:hypothetical protein
LANLARRSCRTKRAFWTRSGSRTRRHTSLHGLGSSKAIPGSSSPQPRRHSEPAISSWESNTRKRSRNARFRPKECRSPGHRSMALIPGFPDSAIATRTATGFQTCSNGSTAPGRPTGFPSRGGNLCRYEKPESYPAHASAPAPKSCSFAAFAAASPCRARLRGGRKPAHLIRPAWLRPPIRSVLAPPRPPAPGATNRRFYFAGSTGITSFISPRPLRPASTIRRT